jgi:hypothetical protein
MPEESNLVPPYVSWGVFKSTVEKLAETIVPTAALDRRVLDGLSGADHGSLMSGMRFLGLVDGQRKATAEYRELVGASKDAPQFSSKLLQILKAKYGPITGHVNIEQGTIAELEKAFKDAGVTQGQMLTKTIRFYVKALQECGIKVSPFILKSNKPQKTPRQNGKPARTQAPAPRVDTVKGRKYEEHLPLVDAIPQGFSRLPIPGIENAFVQYPLDITPQQFALFEAMIGVLRIYVKGPEIGKGGQQP